MRNKLTVQAVEAAIRECKQVGPEAFRRAYGFHRSRRYCLVYQGEEFDSKPIAAVAFKHVSEVGRPLTAKEISGGIATPDCAANLLKALGFEVREMFSDYWDRKEPVGANSDDSDDEDWPDPEGVSEGAIVLRAHLGRERKSANLARILKHETLRRTGRLACVVCEFDFGLTYGTAGLGYIEAHHLVPIAEMDEEAVTTMSDLALVCANCHRMLHRRDALSIGDLRDAIRRSEAQKS